MRSVMLMSCIRSLVIQSSTRLNILNPPAFNRVLDWITNDRMQLINITDRINEIVRKSGVRDGIVHLQSLHTTTAVFLNEWQDALLQDVKRFLGDVVGPEKEWRHKEPPHSDS